MSDDIKTIVWIDDFTWFPTDMCHLIRVPKDLVEPLENDKISDWYELVELGAKAETISDFLNRAS